MKHAEFVQSLRNAADFFEARPELGVPSCSEQNYNFCGDINGKSLDSRAGLAEFIRLVGGRIDKDEDDYWYRLVSWQHGFSVRALAWRSAVCEQVKVGVKIEPAHVIPAQEETEVPEREVPVYEWRCPSLLAPEEESVEA
jgi:hypothetical protein